MKITARNTSRRKPKSKKEKRCSETPEKGCDRNEPAENRGGDANQQSFEDDREVHHQ